jgi:nucleotide-binding universal stress UspA family protein
MRKIVAALDNSLAARPLLATARALAAVLDAEVEALHVAVDGGRTAREAAEAAEVPFRVERGPVVERLVAAGEDRDVVALVIGARGTPSAPRPVGSTAAAVATALGKPVVVVPPEALPAEAVRRVLVPLEGSVSGSLAPASIFELAHDARLEVVALHIHEAESLPAFTDQPQHEHEAWTREFLARYCPHGLGQVELVRRVGRAADLVPQVAEEHGCDLIALGWSQELAAGRAPVVRGALECSRVPVLLVPSRPAAIT